MSPARKSSPPASKGDHAPSANSHPADAALDLIWGCKAIARVLGVTDRACYHMLEKGELPARQIGQRWVVSRDALRRHFEGQAA